MHIADTVKHWFRLFRIVLGRINRRVHHLKTSMTPIEFQHTDCCTIYCSIRAIFRAQNISIFRQSDASRTWRRKVFRLCKETNRFYLAKDEPVIELPEKSKRILFEVMFLCDLALPRYDDDEKYIFDDKIGIWPFFEVVLA